MTPPLFRHVLDRFPQHTTLIQRLARESQEFCSLCEDYALVIETIDRLKDQRTSADGSDLAEYGSFRLELELDIADALTRATM
jgi:hypothetical protein